MLVVVVLAVMVAGAAASSVYGPRPVIPIVKDNRNQNAYGEYSFQYSSPYGDPVEITFVADHGGYQPQGAVLPVAPPLPYSRTGH
ncbi:Larval cuticle protein 2-like 1 [Homarus americanus]|uniref:Larval cuticle protein 2-like 1 n=1 Tax=Homarus americanus TaxID=6706 RepID=A0A8J5MZF1_HOMAM|nr:Larval cuticle protein 2-like 1 [Homarus americanus]